MADINYWTQATGHRLSRRRVLRGAAVGGVGLMGAALIGCGDDSDGPASSGTSAAGVAAAPAGVKRGGRFSLAVDGDPPAGFDLHAGSTSNGSYMITPAYNQLVQFDPLVST